MCALLTAGWVCKLLLKNASRHSRRTRHPLREHFYAYTRAQKSSCTFGCAKSTRQTTRFLPVFCAVELASTCSVVAVYPALVLVHAHARTQIVPPLSLSRERAHSDQPQCIFSVSPLTPTVQRARVARHWTMVCARLI